MFLRRWPAAPLAVLLGATVLAAVPAHPRRARRAVKPAITTLMYIVNTPESIASFRAHAGEVSIAAPQCFTMDAGGFVSGQVPPEVAEVAAEQHVALMPLVTNRGFSQPLMHTVLDTPASRARAIRYLIYYARRDGYLGFQFDYEHIHYTYRRRFSAFFQEAAAAFHRHHLQLSIAVVGRLADANTLAAAPGGYADWGGVYDYRAIGRAADFVSVMAYPEHAGFSGPGPLAGYDWVQQVLRYTLARIPARKVSLGVPIYGIQWKAIAPSRARQAAFAQDNEGQAHLRWAVRSVSFQTIAQLMTAAPVRWDADTHTHYLAWPKAEGDRQVWYEDAASLTAKLDLVRQDHMPGISAWRMGMEDPAIWPLLARTYRIRHPHPSAARGTFTQRSQTAAH